MPGKTADSSVSLEPGLYNIVVGVTDTVTHASAFAERAVFSKD